MNLGSLHLKNSIFLAPMAGITNSAFRQIVKDLGCGLVFTEMVNARGLVEGLKNARELAEYVPREKPIGLQIFGSDPSFMARAAALGEEEGFDLIDINMGCPTPKIVKNGEGAALMKDLPLASEIMSSVVKAVNIPVTVKIRRGWSREEMTALTLAERAEEAGVSLVTVHGRSREEFYGGEADWNIIREVKKRINIPLVGNGDIRGPLQAQQIIEETNCDGIMLGRGAMGNPWIFKRIDYYLNQGVFLPPPPVEEIVRVALKHLKLLIDLKGEYIGVREMRKHASWYIKGMKGAARARRQINSCRRAREMEKVLKSLLI
ncbi:MAG: tRNA dihydrouridine synthase DusB [Candidatus Syntrophonatronum acetioxidans]|uniref:tRNA-dihydrouridine synthase n=1 Tax=Candidatus Syntrophonatronum acetioxidans TaxID=1795816 RepID=A0A424YF16_9FIRM|nr:MAG: tRNA dihydrouridine synthase DusB [Candidatus Syntrophonatronum acetioxidans]